MSRRKMQRGTCRLCQKESELSFEHIPPKVAFNKNTRYYSIPFSDFSKSKNYLKHKPKGKVLQGGLGYYTLCRNCNSFLNENYIRAFSKFVNIGMDINLKYDINYLEFTAFNQNPFRILKQIISMFISMNEPWFGEQYPELVEFISNPNLMHLPNRYRVYLYLNDEGQIRTSKWNFTNHSGVVCEFTFPPFGYVLNIDNENGINHLTEISGWKNYSDNNNHSFEIGLHKYPTYLPIPMDYRTKLEIEKNHKDK